MGSKKPKNTLEFLGMASEQVTGSSYLIKWAGKQILVECGMSQTNNLEKDYVVNSRQFKFKPKQLDYVFLMHLHADHICLVPKLIKEGFSGKIIVPEKSYDIAKIMWEDSAHIILKDSEYLTKCYGKKYNPIYEKEDVNLTLDRTYEYKFGIQHKICDEISFILYPSQHIISASQIQFILKDGNKTKRILYTSDLGNIRFGSSIYCTDFVPVSSSDICICETTYCSKEKSTRSKKDRDKDLEKLKSVVNQFVVENKKKVLVPVFALARTQMVLKLLYDSFKNSQEEFDIVIDSPMAVKITRLYEKLLTGKEKREFEEILNWNKLKLLEDFDSSKACIQSNTPMVVLSASGMMTNGRSVSHLQSIIEDEKCCVLTCGFASPTTLAGIIKEGKHKTIKIGKEEYKNKVQLVQLTTMSSHMQYDDLLEYYSSINCQEIYLVHGNSDRYEFAQTLEDEYRKLNKTTKVFIGMKDNVVEI